jgi:tetratricopeptide (TPR) repeat protein
MPSIVWNDKSLLSLISGLLVIALPFILRRQAFFLSVGLIISLVGLVPNLGLIPFAFQDHSTVADRYAYVALFGVALVVAWLSRLKWVRVILIILLPVVGFLSFRQVALWQDQVSLFTHVLEVNPRSVVALDGLGVDAYRQGDTVRAEDFFRRALAVNPRASRSWFNVGSVLWLKGDINAATEALETSLKLDPNHPDTLNNLGFVYAGTGKDQAAESLFRRALYVNRLDLDARYNLAQLMHKQGKAEESARLLDEAITINPAFAEKYFGKKAGP